MINFSTHILGNGLRLIFHHDNSTPLVAMNILYDVGARDEEPEKTGFAHLFEHLMFGGSVNIPVYDEPLQRAGGENNAFTNNDITNYYLTLPSVNAETAFWLESDRMLGLGFSEKSLEVQRSVVSEEFKQRYLNQPYGDLWLLLRPMAYKVHPYRWPTIGRDLSHITHASMDDVRQFYSRYYHPSNAIMTVAGNIDENEVLRLAEKWFAPIPAQSRPVRRLPVEPLQTAAREMTVERRVPYDAICKAYHCCARHDKEFYTTDLISDLLSAGQSSRLYENLVKKKRIFSEIDAYITGDIDPGLFIFYGKLTEGLSREIAEAALAEETEKIIHEPVTDRELEKLKNRMATREAFSDINILNRAMKLSYACLLGDTDLANTEIEKYREVSAEDVGLTASQIFREQNCSTLFYQATK